MSHQEISEELLEKVKQTLVDELEQWRKDPGFVPIMSPQPSVFTIHEGFVRRDVFGRVFIDRCADDTEHILRPPPPGQERRDQCRFYLDDLIPGAYEGQKVTVEVSIRITPCTGENDVRAE